LANENSYNRISVDGDTSTNDMLAVLANGASGVKVSGKDMPLFREALGRVAQDLAIQIARDGEGARKLIRIQVTGRAGRCRRGEDRKVDCEFAAGEDCYRWL
jgi:glutamate N-acetyltransferase/amino-acid N-acetyltransferase